MPIMDGKMKAGLRVFLRNRFSEHLCVAMCKINEVVDHEHRRD